MSKRAVKRKPSSSARKRGKPRAGGRAASRVPTVSPRISRPRPPKKVAQKKVAQKKRPLAQAAVHAIDDRGTLGLLMAPFLLVAMAVGINQASRSLTGFDGEVAIHAPGDGAARSHAEALRRLIRPVPRVALAPTAPAPAQRASVATTMHPVRLPAAIQPVGPPAADRDVGLSAADTLKVETREDLAVGAEASASVCVAAAEPQDASAQAKMPTSVADRAEFGLKLAAAAQAQTGGFVIYNDKYRHMRYPMGDVSALFGVCTDVVVRAYRTLGLDLQELVHRARVGSGDASIDHRRTEVLRRFFAAYGDSLPITQFAEDYLPGDIVTYYRADNRSSQSHIAVVSDVIAPSGRPMIIHNRGWGPQMEDALFVDRMTGHYRYAGLKRPGGPPSESAEEASQSGKTQKLGAHKAPQAGVAVLVGAQKADTGGAGSAPAGNATKDF